jgi:hypothetical protein
VNFGHRPWWYGGHFCQKVAKNLEKQIISKRNNLNKGKNLVVGQKYDNRNLIITPNLIIL